MPEFLAKSRLREAALAVQFLTIVPVRMPGEVSEGDMAGAASFFPVAGALQGVLAVLTAMVFAPLFSAETAACMILIILILGNGGFHLDGLADTFDALAVPSTGDPVRDRQRRLDVMKDSSVGAAGVIALVAGIVMKWLLLRELLLYSSSVARYSLLLLMPVFSAWTMVQSLHRGMPARGDGLGSRFIGAVTRREAIISSLVTLPFCLLVAELLQHTSYAAATAVLFVILFAVLFALCLLSVRFFSGRFGGLTGDSFGAIHEAAEILFLMVATLWLRHSI